MSDKTIGQVFNALQGIANFVESQARRMEGLEAALRDIKDSNADSDLRGIANFVGSQARRMEELEVALRDIKDDNADMCPECKYNEGIAKVALTRGLT